MSYIEPSNLEVTESFSKENFETWYEEIVGEPITLSQSLWHKVASDIEHHINMAIQNAVTNISRDIYEETY